MSDLELRANALLNLFDSEARQVFGDFEVEELPELDAAAQVLRRAIASTSTLRVGFLGESQVGKSSIINALVGQRVLPSGGVGPLTAQATTIAYASTPSIRVRYHARQRLNEFRFALQGYLQSLGEWTQAHAGSGEADAEPEENETFGAIDFSSNDPGARGSGDVSDDRRQVGEYLVSQARLILGLSSDLPRLAVFELVRAVATKDESKIAWPADAVLRERVEHVRRVLDSTEEFTKSVGAKEFQQALKVRAAGWMSPLVAELHVTLDLALLDAVRLIDLPGVGVVGDPAGRVAEEFVRKDADALVIVMRNNGLTEQVAGLLERTGVISRLFWGADSGEPSIHVGIVVTRLDDVAKDTWRQRALEARESGEDPPKRGEVFRDLADQMASMVRRQVAEALMRSRDFDDLSPELRAKRERVVRDLCERMTVVCVSAPDFLGLVEGFEEDCFLRVRTETNIPLLAQELTELSTRIRDARARRITQGVETLTSVLGRVLQHQEHLRRDRKAARSGADEKFRSDLDAVAKPLKLQAQEHRRAFLGLLAEAMPKRLTEVSEQAAQRARRRLTKLTDEGAAMRWKTLNAALVRNGTFKGAHNIEYPGMLTRAFVDVVAGSWEDAIVAEVRAAFRVLCDSDADLVETLSVAATDLLRTDELNVTLRELKKQLREQGRVSITWTQAQLEELSDDVRVTLTEVVQKPIEKACRAAEKEGRNRGEGARDRILKVFHSGGIDAISDARQACVTVLGEHLKRLRRSLGHVLRENYDPISYVCESIADAQSSMIAKLGEQRRKEQLTRLQRLSAKYAEVSAGSLAGVPNPTDDDQPPMSRPAVAATAGSNVRSTGGVFDGL